MSTKSDAIVPEQTAPASKDKKKNRNNTRMENFRLMKGQETTAAYHSKIEQMYSMENVFKDMSAGETAASVALPVTTRGIGFLIVDHWQKLMARNVNVGQGANAVTPNTVYRISLAQLQHKVKESRPKLFTPPNYFDQETSVRMSEEYKQEILACKKNFGLVAEAINSCGNITVNEMAHHPVLTEPPLSSVGDYAFQVPDPYNVNFSNLEAIVGSLSNPNTPEQFRIAFRDRCPIPCAQWNAQNILVNPEEIWPPEYSVDTFHVESMMFTGMLAMAAMKNKSWVKEIDYSDNGSEALLSTVVSQGVWRVEYTPGLLPMYREPPLIQVGSMIVPRTSLSLTLGAVFSLGEWVDEDYRNLVNPEFYGKRNPRYFYTSTQLRRASLVARALDTR